MMVNQETGHVELMSIGEFARRSRLSQKALRRYDELGVLTPAHVDESSGYRFYDPAQLRQARLVADLRQLHMPLAEINAILALKPTAAAQRIDGYWAAAEREHSARRQLAGYLVDQLNGKRSTMYEVKTREIPERRVLCLKRHVADEQAQWAVGKEFVGLVREHALPWLEGPGRETFCIYWGEVNDDGDGPLEWCRPIPADQAEALAAGLPQLQLRTEPAHREAFVDLGRSTEVGPAAWQLASESLHGWAADRAVRPADMGVRINYRASAPLTDTSAPDLDFAVPFED
jgi:DNA-binding transcriptional MerR regulator